ncbi:MAG: periplasmic heavy metal sensor [Proteobacteria bacterium]|nr:periplasmic heavy metal sensor [Pseudomonadota bacterium]MCP4921291.1 periplasmic heavy metal sensor [Pseudomonadota bacterium]
MKKSLGILGLSALVGTLAFGSLALARGPGGPGGFGPDAHMKLLLEKLDLDDAQKEQAIELRDASREAHMALADERQATMGELLDELGSDEPNRRKVHDAIDDGLDSMGQMLHDRADGVLDLVETFTPKQKATLVAELESMGDERAERREAFEQRGAKGLE